MCTVYYWFMPKDKNSFCFGPPCCLFWIYTYDIIYSNLHIYYIVVLILYVGTYLLHPKFFILVCYTLCFTPYPFHPWCFISLISSLVFSSPGYHPIPFPTQLAKIPFHPNLFIPIKDIYYFILAFFILKIERMTCTGWKRRVKSVNMKLIRWKT